MLLATMYAAWHLCTIVVHSHIQVFVIYDCVNASA